MGFRALGMRHYCSKGTAITGKVYDHTTTDCKINFAGILSLFGRIQVRTDTVSSGKVIPRIKLMNS